MISPLIWILEDDTDMAPLYDVAFREGFNSKIFRTLADLDRARASGSPKPDLLIADLHLPDGEFHQYLEESKPLEFPFFVLTASDKLVALEACFRFGASDYLVKPVNATELRVKVEKQISLEKERAAVAHFVFGDLNLDTYAQQLERVDHPKKVPLTQTEFKLIALFFQNPERPLLREEIIDALWENKTFSGKVLDFHLAKAREKISDLSLEIVFNRRDGYRLSVSA